MHQTCLIATARDEAPWLLEWVAHNLAIGFDRIVVATNTCTDGTDAMLDRLMELGKLRHFNNPKPYAPLKLQSMAYERARRFPEVANATWIMPMDVDEFLNIHIGAGSLPELLATVPQDRDALAVCWRVFGDGGTTGWIDGPICDSLTRAADPAHNTNMVKVLFRNHHEVPRITAHGPAFFPDTPAEAVFPIPACTADGAPLPADRISNTDRPFFSVGPGPRGWEVAQINHYMVKNREMFHLKRLRGTASRGPKAAARTRHSEDSFAKYNQNQDTDTSIRRTRDKRNEVLGILMADETLSRLHRQATDLARARLADLMQGDRVAAP